MEKVAIGIDVGGMSIKGGVVSNEGKILIKEIMVTNANDGQDRVLKDMKTLVDSLIKKAKDANYEVIGVGFGIPGSANNDTKEVAYAPNLHFHHVNMDDAFKGYNYSISNDANVAALGEQRFGAAKGKKNVVMITLGTGVGSGIIIGGKLYEGNEYQGAEIGHSILVLGGKPCNCGRRGCFEVYASATALMEQTKEAMEKDKNSLMWKYVKENEGKVGGRTSFECAKLGDKTAIEVVNQYICYLSEGILDIINIFRPEAVVIGGGISNQGDYLREKVVEYCEKANYGMPNSPKVDILIASLKNDAGIIGAASLIL